MVKKITQKTNKFFRNLRYSDLLIIFLFLVLAISFFIFFFRATKFLTIKVKITEKNVLYAGTNPPTWFVYLFKKGMKEKDGLGRINAEIVDVYYYETARASKAVYLTVKLRTTYNNRSGEYKYKGTTVAVGEGIRLNLGKILAEGLIVEVEGLKNYYKEVFLKIKTRWYIIDPNFSETTGIDSYFPDAIKIGDKIFDSSKKLMVEVLEKEVLPAQKNTFDAYGNVYLKNDPRKKDVFLTLKVRVKKINNEYFFFDDIRVKIGEPLPLHFSKISLFPTIIDIESE